MGNVKVEHEAGYICAMLFIIPGFPFITSGIDLAKLDLRSGKWNGLMYAVDYCFGCDDVCLGSWRLVLGFTTCWHFLTT